MDVPRVDSAQLRLQTAQMVVDTALDLVRGDRFAATVVAAHEAGEVVLATPRGTFASQTDIRLAVGQSLTLEVVRSGAAPTLRIVDGAFHFDEQAFAEAVVEAVRRHIVADRPASASSRPATLRDVAAALQQHLDAPGSPLTPDQRAAAAKLLSPLDPKSSTGEMADHLRLLVQNGGTLLEPRMRAALAGGAAAHGLPDEVMQDLRVLVGALMASPGDDTARADARQRLGARLADGVLDRQLDQALQWIKHGTLSVDVPLADGREGRVRMTYEREPARESPDDVAAHHGVSLSFDLEPLGRVEVDLRWSGASASLRVRAQDDAARVRFDAGLNDLRAALRVRGLSLRHADVVVGVAPDQGDAVPADPPPSGSILRLVG